MSPSRRRLSKARGSSRRFNHSIKSAAAALSMSAMLPASASPAYFWRVGPALFFAFAVKACIIHVTSMSHEMLSFLLRPHLHGLAFLVHASTVEWNREWGQESVLLGIASCSK
jgi:hypothetical protein